ncbi:MAG: hypothetical protein JSV88_11305 [Candidatus Aminicenantes bacterium]|nr:MAG: hypothetical protein JSV88_11305 [Candidatus Aminicenantes bacterium]
MVKRKDLPIGMGAKTEAMIRELEFHLQVNGHDLVRKMIRDLNDPAIKNEFMAYTQVNQIKRIEKSSRIQGFKFKEKEIEEFTKMQWRCRIKGLSTFIKQLVYFNYEKYIGNID